MRKQTCCFTGHRHLPEERLGEIQRRLDEVIEALVRQDMRYFGCGGALGFDTQAALAVLRARERHPEVRLILVLPCRNQTRGWPTADIEMYSHIYCRADKVVYIRDHYARGCMHERNRRLVDNSAVCVCYLTQPAGGTHYTVEYARRQGLSIINLSSP